MPRLNPTRTGALLDRRLDDKLGILMSYFFPAGASALYSISHALANPHIRDISGDMYAMAAALGIPTLYHAARRYPGGVPYLVTKNLHGTPEAINPLAPSMMMGKISSLADVHARIFLESIIKKDNIDLTKEADIKTFLPYLLSLGIGLGGPVAATGAAQHFDYTHPITDTAQESALIDYIRKNSPDIKINRSDTVGAPVYDLLNKQINIPTKTDPALLAHEYGHHLSIGGGNKAYTVPQVVSRAGVNIGMIAPIVRNPGYVRILQNAGSLLPNKAINLLRSIPGKDKLIHPAVLAALSPLTLYEEANASIRGANILKQLGHPISKIQGKKLGGYFGTYLAGALFPLLGWRAGRRLSQRLGTKYL